MKKTQLNTIGRAAMACVVLTALTVQAGEVEVLHYWTSGGEAKAAAALKATLQGKGHTWKDFAVAGGGGDNAMTVLKSRVVSGNAPAAAQIKGPSLQEWAAEGVLANIDDVAKAEKWDSLLPPVVANVMKYKGNYIAAPVNVHRVNWLWASNDAFKKAGAKVPTNWDEFFVAAEALKKAGIIPVAHGGQNWQDFTTFESVALGVGGADFYKKALVQLDQSTLTGATMTKVLDTFKKVKTYTDKNAPGRDWNLATAMVIKGEAGMQMMGDWAKGEFLKAGKKPGTDFVCIRFPGTQGSVTFNSDQFAMFNQTDAGKQEAQVNMAKAIMDPAFQSAFNVVKGSVPARTDVPNDAFDDCGKKGMADLAEANTNGTLYGSMAHGHAAPAAVKNATYDVITAAFNGEYADGAAAAAALAEAVAAAQ